MQYRGHRIERYGDEWTIWDGPIPVGRKPSKVEAKAFIDGRAALMTKRQRKRLLTVHVPRSDRRGREIIRRIKGESA